MSYTPSPSPPNTPPTSDSECEGDSDANIYRLNSFIVPISTPSHPFAASTKANRLPPAYEKKPFTPPATPPDSKGIPPLCGDQSRGPGIKAAVTRHIASPSLADAEQKRWDVAISSAIDKAETKLDLSNAGLTYIPSSIIDLKGLVILARSERPTTSSAKRAFMRSTTAPAILPSPHARPFLPSRTTNTLVFGALGKQSGNFRKTAADGRCEMELYLMRNTIRRLPRELFALDHLVVLSLRQNKLTSLPPAICKLTRLRELNVANNRLSCLPAEIQDLHLDSLHLYPNPFTAPPTHLESQSHSTNRMTRILGPLKRGSSVPTLVELALRRLLSPTTPALRILPSLSETCLEAAMTLAEINSLPLPLHIKRVVRASTGHGRTRDHEEGVSLETELDMTINVCPCPQHHSLAANNPDSRQGVRFMRPGSSIKRGMFAYNSPVFGVPVEERMEWVGIVAGVNVAENPSAWVPLLWRGCGPGCLDFLERKRESGTKDQAFESGRGVEDDEFQFSDSE